MSFRFVGSACLLLMCVGLCGCFPSAEAQMDEQKNPYFMAGKERVTARDFKGAVEAFKKALEINPRSALAHFELGVLYEQNENDCISALYHYNRALELRPQSHPADNARLRIAGCKQELVRSESLAPVYQAMQRDLDKLKEENALLRRQLEAWQAQSVNRSPVSPGQNPTSTQIEQTPPRLTSPLVRTNSSSVGRIVPSPRASGTPLPPVFRSSKAYTIKSGDTLASIARKQGVTLSALTAANPTVDPRRLSVGRVINVPTP